MADGYEEYEGDDVLAAVRSGREKLYLIRAPLDLDLSRLNGAKVDLRAVTASKEPVILGGGYRLQGDDFGQQVLRAVVLNPVTGQPTVGPSFAGSLSLKYDSSIVQALVPDRRAEPLPLNAYKPAVQLVDLRIRSMPKGSTTPIESLWNAPREHGVRKKRGAEASAEEGAGAVVGALAGADVNGEKKKQKKEKKEKKSRKDKE